MTPIYALITPHTDGKHAQVSALYDDEKTVMDGVSAFHTNQQFSEGYKYACYCEIKELPVSLLRINRLSIKMLNPGQKLKIKL